MSEARLLAEEQQPSLVVTEKGVTPAQSTYQDPQFSPSLARPSPMIAASEIAHSPDVSAAVDDEPVTAAAADRPGVAAAAATVTAVGPALAGPPPPQVMMHGPLLATAPQNVIVQPTTVVVNCPQLRQRVDPVPFHKALLTNPGIPSMEMVKWSLVAIIATVLFSVKPLLCIMYSGRSYCKNESLKSSRMVIVFIFTLPMTIVFTVCLNLWLRYSLIPLTNACVAGLQPSSLLGSANPELRLKFVELGTWYSNFLIGGLCGVMLSNYLVQFIALFIQYKLIADLTIDNVIAGVSTEYGIFVMLFFYLPVWLVFFSLCLFTNLCYSLQCAAVMSGVDLPPDVVDADPPLPASPTSVWTLASVKPRVIHTLDGWFAAPIMREIKSSRGGKHPSKPLSLPTGLSDSSVGMAHVYIVARHALNTWAYFQILLVWFGKTVTGLGMLWNGVLLLVSIFGSSNGGFQAWGVLIPLVSVFTGVTWAVSSFKMRRATRVILETAFEAKVPSFPHCPAGDDGFKAFDAVRTAMLSVDANGEPLTDVRALVRFYDSNDPSCVAALTMTAPVPLISGGPRMLPMSVAAGVPQSFQQQQLPPSSAVAVGTVASMPVGNGYARMSDGIGVVMPATTTAADATTPAMPVGSVQQSHQPGIAAAVVSSASSSSSSLVTGVSAAPAADSGIDAPLLATENGSNDGSLAAAPAVAEDVDSRRGLTMIGPFTTVDGLPMELVARMHSNGGRSMLSVPSARTRQFWKLENRVCNIHGAVTLLFLIYYLNELATAKKVNSRMQGITSTLCVFAICQTSSGLLVQCFSDAIQSRSNVFGKSLLCCLLIFFIRRSHQLQNMTESSVSKSHFAVCEAVFIILAVSDLLIIVFGLCFSEPMMIVAVKRLLLDPLTERGLLIGNAMSSVREWMQSKVYVRHEQVFDRIIPGRLRIRDDLWVRNSTLFVFAYQLALLNIFTLCLFLIGKAAQSGFHSWTALQLIYPMIWLLFSFVFKNECRQFVELHLYIPELKAMKAKHVKRLNGSKGMIQAFLPLLLAICVVVFGYTAEFASKAGIGFLAIEMLVCLPCFSLAVWQD